MINLYHLRYFCDACRARNMSAAARANRVSHSAISQAIRGLEVSLGEELLLHGKRRFQTTPAGERLFRRAEEIFRNLDELQSSPEGARPPRGPVKIGLSMSIGAGPLGRPLAEFLARYPDLDPDISLGNSASLERLLAAREIEVGFGVEDGNFVNFERKLLRRGKFVLLTGSKVIESRPRYLVGDKGREVKEFLAQVKKVPGARIGQVQGWALIAHLVSLGLGIGLVPDFLLEAHPKLRLVESPSFKLPSYELCAFFRNADHLSPGARVLLQFLSDRK